MKQFYKLNIFIGFVLMFSISISGCEKRIPLDTPFPYVEDLIFCELIGIPNVGFQGVIQSVNSISTNDNFDISAVKLTIYEDDHIVYNQFLVDSKIEIKYVVKHDFEYAIKIEYLDQTIVSSRKVAAPEIEINDFEYQNNYIESLGLEVASLSYSCGGNTDSLYYINIDELVSPPFNGVSFGISDLPKLLLGGKQAAVSKRLPNPNRKDYIQSIVISIDHEAFQYYKLSSQLGSIPNDMIDGHQGNLEGGIGYFGVIDFDLEIRKF